MEDNNVVLEDSEKKKNSKVVIIVATILVIVAILACIAVIPNLFKSNSKKFVEQLLAKQYVGELIEDRVDSFPDNGEKKLNIAVKNNFLSSIIPSFGFIQGDLVLDVNTIKTKDNLDLKAKLKIGSINLQSLDLVTEDKTLALSVPNLFDGFVAINNDNTKRVSEKLGLDFDFDFEKKEYKIDFKSVNILNRYLKSIGKCIDNNITIEQDKVSIEGKELDADRYTLLLGQKDLNEIGIIILEKLKDDEDALKLIVDIINENENLSSMLEKEYTVEELKSSIKDIYDNLVSNEITDNTQVLKIDLYAYRGKTVKTVMNFKLDEKVYEITFETINDKENDYVLITLDIEGQIIKLNYNGKMLDGVYNGEVTLGVEGSLATLVEINAEVVKDSDAKPRTIKELNALLLNNASDEELENFKKELESNLGISENYNPYDDEGSIYEEGEFKIASEAERIKILESSVETYNTIKIGMTKTEVFDILGTPDDFFEFDDFIGYTWYYNHMEDVAYISAAVVDDKVEAVYNEIASSMENNIQISKELGTEINDLNEIISNVKEEMTKEEIIKVLGDKYLEIYKDSESYSVLKWYDKNENVVEVEFDNDNLAYYIGDVLKDL